jgi:serralysin
MLKMSETTQTTPTVSDYLNASYWAYAQAGTPYPDRDTTLPTGFSYFTPTGQSLITYDPDAGLYAAAVINATGQIIVTFEGTNLYTGNDTFTTAQVLDDYEIVEGRNAASYQPALAFTQTVISAAEAAGYTTSDIFLAGHSLGAAEAEYVATQTGLSGTTFGTPGIPTGDIPATTPSQFTDYVERGDPVGNYAVGWNDFDLLQTQNVQHFGTALPLGSYESASLLYLANATYVTAENAPTKVEELAGIAATVALLDKAAVDYHALLTYATDLGVTVSGASGDIVDTGTADVLAQALFNKLPDVTIGSDGSVHLASADLTAPGAVSVGGGGVTLTLGGQSVSLGIPADGKTISLQSDGQGGSVISARAASDGLVLGGSDGATIQGDSSPLLFVGGTGSVSVTGGSGSATLFGASSSTATTFLKGGSGQNVLHGGAGPTILIEGTGASTLVGGTGITVMLANGNAGGMMVAGSGATTIDGATGGGNQLIFAGSGSDLVALGQGADTLVGSSGVTSVLGGAGPDIYGFINGHAGGAILIAGLKPTDALVFGGYAGNPIAAEGVTGAGDLITLTDGTHILLEGISHKLFS